MSLFNLFNRRNKKLLKSENKGNENIVELAKIISNNNSDIVEDITLLTKDYESFISKYKNWCDKMFMATDNTEVAIKEAFIFWLCGHETENTYGVSISNKENVESIIGYLKVVIKKLGYELETDKIKFLGNEQTFEVLQLINEHFMKSSYTLFNMDLGSNTYNLFIVPIKHYYRITVLSEEIGYTVFNEFEI